MTRRIAQPSSSRSARQRQPTPTKRLARRSAPVAPRPAPTIEKLGFTCFRLVAVYGGEPGDPPYAARRVRETTTRMRVFMHACAAR